MWLRSEKRSSRITKSTKSPTNLKKIIKNASTLRSLKATTSSSRRGASLVAAITAATKQSNSRSTIADAKSTTFKCNIKGRATVKRLNKRPNTTITKRSTSDHVKSIRRAVVSTPVAIKATRQKSLRNISDHGKENCWQDDESATTFPVTDKLSNGVAKRHRRRKSADTNRPEHLNRRNVAPVDDNSNACKSDVMVASAQDMIVSATVVSNEQCEQCQTLEREICSCNFANGSADELTDQSTSGSEESRLAETHCVNYIECDSTTDNDRGNLPSIASMITMATATVTSATVLTDAKTISIDPEIDSTTDLIMLPTGTTSSSSASSSSSSSSLSCSEPVDPFKMSALPSQGFATESTDDKFSIRLFCTQAMPDAHQMLQPMATTSNAAIANFATTPDLITLFDEEMNNKSDGMCQYSDLFPYNNCMSSAFLNCNEANTMVGDQNDSDATHVSNDLTFLSSINQTAIDNLKALTNLHNHSTNFLSNITLPKSNYGDVMNQSEYC